MLLVANYILEYIKRSAINEIKIFLKAYVYSNKYTYTITDNKTN